MTTTMNGNENGPRTANATRLFNKLLECEHALNELRRPGAFAVHEALLRKHGQLAEYLAVRAALRVCHESLLIHETPFATDGRLHQRLWRNCYEEPLNALEAAVQTAALPDAALLRNWSTVLIDEGCAFYRLLLQAPAVQSSTTQFQYDLHLALASLLHKRTRLSVHQEASIVSVLRTAISLLPLHGPAYCLLADWTRDCQDQVHACFWYMTALNVDHPHEETRMRLMQFCRAVATSPSFFPRDKRPRDGRTDDSMNLATVLCTPLLQLAVHAVVSQLGGQSHRCHLEAFARSVIRPPDRTRVPCDWKTVRCAIDTLWMVVGSRELFAQERGDVTFTQCLLLAKLFQCHVLFRDDPSINDSLLVFATNPHYYALFSGTNYDLLSRQCPFARDALHALLNTIASDESTPSATIEDGIIPHCMLDYLMLSSFKHCRKSENGRFVEFDDAMRRTALCSSLVHDSKLLVSDPTGGVLRVRSQHEKEQRVSRTMKLLTHRLLQSQVQRLQDIVAPAHQVTRHPWMIVDYATLLDEFDILRRIVERHDGRFFITAALLHQLDAGKGGADAKLVRDVIRFLHERVEAHDPSIRLQSDSELPPSNTRLDRSDFQRIETAAIVAMPLHHRSLVRFHCDHLKSIRHVVAHCGDEQFVVVCRTPVLHYCASQDASLTVLSSLGSND